jgi:hypothetical protein
MSVEPMILHNILVLCLIVSLICLILEGIQFHGKYKSRKQKEAYEELLEDAKQEKW